MTRWLRGLAFVLLVTCAAVQARAQDLQVIDLHHRLADEIIPIVRPLVEPGGVLTGTDDVLFVRASPENVEQIRQAVAALDRAPLELTITVGQGTVREVDAAAVEGSATIGDGDVQVGVNRPPAGTTGAQIEARARRQVADLHNLSTVRTLEGSEAWIGVGQSVPITQTYVTGGIVQQTTGYHDATTGFYATARVNGDRVTLEISPRQQRLRRGTGELETQGAATTVSGRLGEWFPIGGVTATSQGSSGGLLVWGARTDRSDYTAWVKVEAAE